jgi:hypothetical protein
MSHKHAWKRNPVFQDFTPAWMKPNIEAMVPKVNDLEGINATYEAKPEKACEDLHRHKGAIVVCYQGKVQDDIGQAYAWYDEDGNIESARIWIYTGNGINWTAIHEAGHAIGLVHSDDPYSVMYPDINGVTEWQDSDLQQIARLYGPQK